MHILSENNSPLLKALSLKEKESSLKNGDFRIVSYKKNTLVHLEGESCRKLEIILQGSVVVNSIDSSGNQLRVADFFRGDAIGGNLIFSKNSYYPMTIITQEDSQILEIDKDCLFPLLRQNHDFLLSFLQSISDHTWILGDKIRRHVNRSIRESLLNYLEYERNKQGKSTLILGISKKVLAEKIGVQRTSLSRELTKMKKEGLLDYARNTITLYY